MKFADCMSEFVMWQKVTLEVWCLNSTSKKYTPKGQNKKKIPQESITQNKFQISLLLQKETKKPSWPNIWWNPCWIHTNDSRHARGRSLTTRNFKIRFLPDSLLLFVKQQGKTKTWSQILIAREIFWTILQCGAYGLSLNTYLQSKRAVKPSVTPSK